MYLCFQGSDGSKTVPVQEGAVTDIKIEVCAEDGKTTKTYIIHVKRLSAKDATLSSIKISVGKLLPDFNVEVFNYTCRFLKLSNNLQLNLSKTATLKKTTNWFSRPVIV